MTNKSQKKQAKRRIEKKKEAARDRQRLLGPRQILRQARQYPLENCWVQENWRESGMAVVVVARRQPSGNLIFGTYLVDYYCLGLKSTFCNVNLPEQVFRGRFLPECYERNGPPVTIPPALAHELIYGAIEYAAKWGFKPQRDFRDSQYVLELPETYPRSGAVTFGHEGKPFFIGGPHDDCKSVVRQLQRTAGDGNFDYIAPVGESPFDSFCDM